MVVCFLGSLCDLPRMGNRTKTKDEMMHIKELYKYADIEITGSDSNKTYAAIVEA